MARPKKELPQATLVAMEADWRAGAISPANIAAKYGIDRKTLISRMDGIPREAGPSLKRALVREAAAGIDVVDPQVGEKARELVAAAAQTDASAMTVAARASAAIIVAVETLLKPDQPEGAAKLRPHDLNALALATKNATDAYRKARELDTPDDVELPERRIVLVEANHKDDAP